MIRGVVTGGQDPAAAPISARTAFDLLELHLVRMTALRSTIQAVGPDQVGQHTVARLLSEADAAVDAFAHLVLIPGAMDALRAGLEARHGR